MPYQMSNGKWRGKKMINGAVKTKSFPTKQEAKKWEAAQSAEEWQAQTSPTHIICLIDLANAYLKMAEERFSKKTLNEKRLAFRHLFKYIPPAFPAKELTPKHALDVLRIKALDSGNAANVARKNLAAAWSWGKRYYDLPSVNPFLEVERFPADKHPRYIPSEADFWRVYDAADETDKAFLLCLFHTGARVGEVFRLKWEDVNFHDRKIRLGTRKTGGRGMEYAWLPMTDRLQNSLARHQIRCKAICGLVFCNRNNGKQYTVRQHMMQVLCERAGVKPFGFHAIRHLAATKLAYAGLDLPTVQAMLRHHSPTTTAKYIKSLGIDREKIESVFAETGAEKEGAKVTAFTPLAHDLAHG